MSNNIVKHDQLQDIVQHSWTKTKERHDVAFKNATLSPRNGTDKKITFERIQGANVEVNLEDYVRLQDRNKFKQDVSVDNVAIESNAHIKNVLTNNSSTRLLGYRGLTSKNFVDGHISTLRVLVDSELENNTATSWKLWAIKKDNTNRNGDIVKKAYGALSANVKAVTINGETHKAVDFEINEEFADEVYFIVKSTGSRFRITYPSDPYKQDVVNMSAEPGGTEGDRVDWGTNADNTNTAIMYLYGRESIKSLSEKLDKVNSDSATYVKHSECVTTGGAVAQAGKVVKLGSDGKLDGSLMPAIALNEFITVTAPIWNEQAVASLTYQNGDVIFHQPSQKRYLCVDTTKDFNNGRFIELNSKDGVVSTVNGGRPNTQGDITVTAAQNGPGITMTFGDNSTPVTVATYMTTEEVNEIKRLFT